MGEDQEELQEGESFELPDDADVVDTDDGGAIIRLDETEPEGESEFYENLAMKLPEVELTRLGNSLCEQIEQDKQARSRRDEQYEEGLRRTGLGDDAPGGAQFQGASKVVHPMLTQACVDFSARAMKEIMPPSGPAKEKVVDAPTPDKLEKAKRIATYMNWQCTEQMPGFRAELEQLATQLPLGGGQYLKITWDPLKKKPNPLFVPIDDVYLPFAATNFYTSERKTHVQYITKIEYQNRVDAGMYRDVDLLPIVEAPTVSKAEKANEKIEGKQPDQYNTDGLRTVFECYVIADIEEEFGYAPYVVSIDKTSQKVLAVYRNWEQDDETKEEMFWMVEFPFVPWRGAYPIGLVHMIGGLSGSATTKSPYTFGPAITRVAAVQSWPPLKYPVMAMVCAASSTSASSKMMTGALPPSSRCKRFNVFDAPAATSIPARTEPVTDTIPGTSWSTIARPVSRSPHTTLSTPGGRMSPMILAINAVEAGVVSLGFNTVVFPAAIAGMNFHTPIMSG